MTGYTRKDTSNNIADGNIINADDLDNEFDGVQSAFNAATGHTHDGTAAEGAPITKIGPVQDVIVSASAIYPKTTNTVDLGTSSLKYKDAFLAGSASVGGALAVAGTTTLTSQPILSSLTASSAVATDASKGLVSVTNTGTGNNVLATSPTLVTPLLGTPTSVTLTNATGLPISTGVSGLGTGVATALAVNVGTAGSPVVNGGVLGTPSSGVVTNLTGTASININGTVGATTPTTGAFTTVGATGLFTGANFTIGNAGGAYFGLVNSALGRADANYAVQQSNAGTTIIGAPTGQEVRLSVAGSVIGNVTGTGLAITGTLSATGGVTLSGGTANGVAYLNGSKVLTTGSALTFDGTTFGIGTGFLTVSRSSGVANTQIGLTNNGAGAAGFVLGQGAQAQLFFIYDAGAAKDRYNITSTGEHVWLGSAEQMRLDSSGNLGIGTSSPVWKLDVLTAGTSGARIITAEYGQLSVTDGTRGIYIQNYASAGVIGTSTNNKLIFTTNNVDRMTLDTSGNLGLGVTPSAWGAGKAIEVGNLGSAFWGVGTADIRISANAYFNGSFQNIYGATGFASRYDQTAGVHKWFTAPSGTAGNAITFTQAMTLDASGNLLVGATALAFAEKFQMYGNYAVFKNASYTGFIGGGTSLGTATASDFAIRSSNALAFLSGGATERMRLDSSGNLGIGTSSPQAKLVVSSTGAAGFEFSPNSSGLAMLETYNRSTAAYVGFRINADDIRFHTGVSVTERMRLDASGNLGIGTSSQESRLSSVGNSATDFKALTLRNANTTIGAAAVLNFEVSTGTEGDIAASAGQIKGIRVGGGTSGALAFWTSSGGVSAERMRLDASGNLGIGTSSPARKLDVNGAIRVGSASPVEWGGTTAYITGESSTNTLFFATSGAEKMRLDASGNLGLGVAPSAWTASSAALEQSAGAIYSITSGTWDLAQNAYNSATGLKYRNTSFASLYRQTSGQHVWYNAPSGTAGAAITFTQAMTLDANNILSLGANASAWNPGNVAAELPQFGVLAFQNAGGSIAANGYFSTTGWKYISTNFAAKYDISQSTGGHYWRVAASGTAGNAITFTDAMTLTGGGNLLVGTTSANASLATGIQIASTNWASAFSVTAVASAGTCAAWGRSTDGNVGQFYRDTSFTTLVGSISVTSSATAYNTSSDYRLKDITGPITTSGAYIDSLKPVEGTWKADGSTFVGLIAHEVQEASRTTVATGTKDGEQMQGMDYSSAEIIANLIAELQSVRTRLAALESKLP